MGSRSTTDSRSLVKGKGIGYWKTNVCSSYTISTRVVSRPYSGAACPLAGSSVSLSSDVAKRDDENQNPHADLQCIIATHAATHNGNA